MSSRAPNSSSPRKAGITRTPDGPHGRLLARGAAAPARRLAAQAGHDYVDLWYVHYVDDAVPVRRDPVRPRRGGCGRQGALRGRVELLRVAHRRGRRRGSARCRGARRSWPTRCATRSSTAGIEREVVPACAALGVGVFPWSPLGGGVLTGKYRGGMPSDSRAAVGHRADLVPSRRSGRRPASSRRWRRRPRGWPRRRSRWRWPGCATGPGVVAPILGARTLGQLTARAGVRDPRPAARDPRRPRRRVGAGHRVSGGRALTAGEPAGIDPVFAAFCDAGLWPGLGTRLAAELGDAGIRGPEDVTAQTIRALPKVGPLRAGRLLSSFIAATRPTRSPSSSCRPGWTRGSPVARSTCSARAAPRLLRDDPWRLLAVYGVTPGEADRVARAALPGVRRDDARRARARWSGGCWPGTRATGTPVDARADVADGLAESRCRRRAGRDRRRDRGGRGARVRRRAARARPLRRGRGRDRAGHRPAAGHRRADRRAPERRRIAVLDDTQQAAVHAALHRRASRVLTGGPGTGKSRTVATLVALAEAAGQVGRAGRAHRARGQAARGAVRLPRLDTAPAARRPAAPVRRRRHASTAASPAARSGRWTRTSWSSTRRRCSTSSWPMRC